MSDMSDTTVLLQYNGYTGLCWIYWIASLICKWKMHLVAPIIVHLEPTNTELLCPGVSSWVSIFHLKENWNPAVLCYNMPSDCTPIIFFSLNFTIALFLLQQLAVWSLFYWIIICSAQKNTPIIIKWIGNICYGIKRKYPSNSIFLRCNTTNTMYKHKLQ